MLRNGKLELTHSGFLSYMEDQGFLGMLIRLKRPSTIWMKRFALFCEGFLLYLKHS